MEHKILREKLVSKQLSFLCFIYLRNNNTDNVNRLIQIFLQFNMMKQVETLVKILFEYECEYSIQFRKLNPLKFLLRKLKKTIKRKKLFITRRVICPSRQHWTWSRKYNLVRGHKRFIEFMRKHWFSRFFLKVINLNIYHHSSNRELMST